MTEIPQSMIMLVLLALAAGFFIGGGIVIATFVAHRADIDENTDATNQAFEKIDELREKVVDLEGQISGMAVTIARLVRQPDTSTTTEIPIVPRPPDDLTYGRHAR